MLPCEVSNVHADRGGVALNRRLLAGAAHAAFRLVGHDFILHSTQC